MTAQSEDVEEAGEWSRETVTVNNLCFTVEGPTEDRNKPCLELNGGPDGSGSFEIVGSYTSLAEALRKMLHAVETQRKADA